MSTHTTLSPALIRTKNASVIGVGNTNVITALTDALDSTYVHGTGTAVSQSMTLDLSNFTLSATQRALGLRLKIRNARDGSGGSTQDTSSWLVLWPDTSKRSAVYVNARATTTILSGTGPLIKTPPGKTTEWTNTDLGKVALVTQWSQPHTGTKNVFQRIYEFSVDLEYITQAIVTGAPTVTNFTNNATPNVAWIFNDPDGEEQVAYRTKIFTSATVGASNFNADTSLSVWDSGDVRADASNVDSPIALQNGTTYYAYVKVAKWGPVLPNSTPLWWSPWSASASFTVTFTPPTAPAITATSTLVEESAYRVVMDITTSINLLSQDDASFETATGTWVNLANATLARDTAQFADGVASLKLTSIAAGVMSARTGNPVMRVDYNQTYTALASFRAAVTGRTVQVGVQWLRQDASTVISTAYGTGVTDTTTGFTQATFSATAPLGAKYARATVQVSTPAAGAEVHWVDKVDVHAGSGTTWTPGGFVNDQGGIVLQRQEFLDDQRGPAYNWFSEQVASCGAVTRSATPGFQWDSTSTDLEWMWLDRTLGQSGYTGAGMLRWQVIAVASGLVLAFGWDFYNISTAYSPPIIPSQPHTLSAWLWTDTGTRALTYGIQWRDQNGNTTTNASQAITVTTTPQRFTITGTAPASGSIYASGFLIDNVGSPGPHVFMARIGFGQGSNPVEQFQPVGLTTHEWHNVQFTGTTNTLDQNVPSMPQPPGYATGNVETFVDYEYPPGRPVSYRASLLVTGNNAVVLTSAYGYSPVLYANPPVRTMMRSVTDPTLGCVINRRKTLAYSISDDAQVFHPLGSDRAPVKIRDWVSGEDGTFDVVASTEAQYQRLKRLLSSNDVMMIQWAQGGRSYVIITGMQINEIMSADVDWCDMNGDGTQDHIRYIVASISYIETVTPSTFVTM